RWIWSVRWFWSVRRLEQPGLNRESDPKGEAFREGGSDVGEQLGLRVLTVEKRSPCREDDPEAEALYRGVGVWRIHGDER
ncbi:hypothetical protein U1Q18_042119, partial [Sarracenia purpurea var. burkii]